MFRLNHQPDWLQRLRSRQDRTLLIGGLACLVVLLLLMYGVSLVTLKAVEAENIRVKTVLLDPFADYKPWDVESPFVISDEAVAQKELERALLRAVRAPFLPRVTPEAPLVSSVDASATPTPTPSGGGQPDASATSAAASETATAIAPTLTAEPTTVAVVSPGPAPAPPGPPAIPSAAPAPIESPTAENGPPTDTPAATAEPPSPEPSLTSQPTTLPSPTDVPSAVPPPTDRPTSAPVPTAVPTRVTLPTSVPPPTDPPTRAPLPTAVPTRAPLPTDPPLPTAVPTSVPVPTATDTPQPTATDTPAPTATNTPVVLPPTIFATTGLPPTTMPTNTPVPTDTPIPTDTPAPVPTDTPVPPGTSAFGTIQAENLDSHQGLVVYSVGISYFDGGDWALYRDINFGAGVSQFQAMVGVTRDGEGQFIDVRIDSPSGPIIASLSPTSTGAYSTFTLQSTGAGGVSGLHDLYLVARGSSSWGVGNVDWFTFLP